MSLDEPILMSRVAYPLGKGPARWELAPGHFWWSAIGCGDPTSRRTTSMAQEFEVLGERHPEKLRVRRYRPAPLSPASRRAQ